MKKKLRSSPIKGFAKKYLNESAYPVFLEDIILNFEYYKVNSKELDFGKVFSEDGYTLKKYSSAKNVLDSLAFSGDITHLADVSYSTRIKRGYLPLLKESILEYVSADHDLNPPLNKQTKEAIHILKKNDPRPFSLVRLTLVVNQLFNLKLHYGDMQSLVTNSKELQSVIFPFPTGDINNFI